MASLIDRFKPSVHYPTRDGAYQGPALVIGANRQLDMDSARAMQGLLALGVEVHVTTEYQALRAELSGEDVDPELLEALASYRCIVGDVPISHACFQALGIEREDITYPPKLVPFLGRQVMRCEIFAALKCIARTNRPGFIKPQRPKAFPAQVINPGPELQEAMLGFMHREGEQVWLSETIQIAAEYRCFICQGELVDVRRYGSAPETFKHLPDLSLLRQMIFAFGRQAPAAYVIDLGVMPRRVTPENDTVLIECNDGYAFGSYGLDERLYAEMLLERYAEMRSEAGI